MKLSNKAIKNEAENSNRNNSNTWVSRENSRISRHFPFYLELGMFRQVIISSLVFHKRPTSLSCVQYPLSFRVRDYKNQRTNKQKSNREKYKNMQGHNKSIWETGYWFVHPENVPKWTIKIFFLCIWCISTNKTHFVEGKSHKMWSKTFSSCLLKKKSK